MASGSGALPAFTVCTCVKDSPARSVRLVITVRHTKPPPSGVTGCPVARFTKYGRTWQLLGNVRSTTAAPMFSTFNVNVAVSGPPTNVGVGCTVTRMGAGFDGDVTMALQPAAISAIP